MLLFALPAAAQSDEASEVYDALIRDAIAHFDQRQLDEALALFERAHALRPSARTLRGIGLVHFARGDYVAAASTLKQALDDPRRPLDPEQRAEAASMRERAIGFTAFVDLDVSPADVRVLDNGAPRVPEGGAVCLNPGRHQLLFSREGYQESVRVVEVRSGERLRLRVELEALDGPPPPPSGIPIRVISNTPGLVLHGVLLEPDPGAVPRIRRSTELCIAPCEDHIAPGRYQLGVGLRLRAPRPADEVHLSEPSVLDIKYTDRARVRRAGWFSLLGGVVAATTLFTVVGRLDSPSEKAIGGLLSTGFGFLISGIILVVVLAPLKDTARVRVRPLAPTPERP